MSELEGEQRCPEFAFPSCPAASCTQELCEAQSLWVTAGVCSHIDGIIHAPKLEKPTIFSSILQEARLLHCLGVSTGL